MFSDSAMKIFEETCDEFGIEQEMMRKLIVAVDSNKHYSRGNKVSKAFDRVINEGWLHHENIKAAKEEISNENK